MRFISLEPLTKFFGLLLKTMLMLFLLSNVNINKAVSSDKNCTIAVHFTLLRSLCEGFVMLST